MFSSSSVSNREGSGGKVGLGENLANDERVSIIKLQRFLGHSDIKETMRYLNPRAEHVADAIQSVDFDKLINPAQTNNKEDKK